MGSNGIPMTTMYKNLFQVNLRTIDKSFLKTKTNKIVDRITERPYLSEQLHLTNILFLWYLSAA